MELPKIRLLANNNAWVVLAYTVGLGAAALGIHKRYAIAYDEKVERAQVAAVLAESERQKAATAAELANSERQKALLDTELAIANQKLAIAELEDLSAVRLAINAFIESESFGLIIVNQKGTIKFWNPALEDLTGKKSADVVGKNLAEIMTPESAESHVPKFAAMVRDPSQWGKLVTVKRCQLLHADPDHEKPVVRVRAGIFDTRIGPLGVAQLTLPESIVEVPGFAPPSRAAAQKPPEPQP